MQFDPHAKTAFIVTCIVLVLCGVGFRVAVERLNVFLEKAPVELRAQFSTIPRTLGSWEAVGRDEIVDAATRETLKTDQYLTRQYVNIDDGIQVVLHITYYTGIIDAVPHVPDRCMIAGGYVRQTVQTNHAIELDSSDWREDDRTNIATGLPYLTKIFTDEFTGRAIRVRMPIGDFRFRTTEFLHPDFPDSRTIAGYMFVANGRTTAQPEMIRKLAFELTDEYAYYCKIQLTMRGPADFTAETFLPHVEDFLDEALPEIMRCLPDWSEVEQSTATSTDPLS